MERHLDLLYICSGRSPSVQLLAKYIMGRLDRAGRTSILIMQRCRQQCSSFLVELVFRSWQCYGSRRTRLLVAGFWGGDCCYDISRPGSGCKGVPVKAHSVLSVLFIALWSTSLALVMLLAWSLFSPMIPLGTLSICSSWLHSATVLFLVVSPTQSASDHSSSISFQPLSTHSHFAKSFPTHTLGGPYKPLPRQHL